MIILDKVVAAAIFRQIEHPIDWVRWSMVCRATNYVAKKITEESLNPRDYHTTVYTTPNAGSWHITRQWHHNNIRLEEIVQVKDLTIIRRWSPTGDLDFMWKKVGSRTIIWHPNGRVKEDFEKDRGIRRLRKWSADGTLIFDRQYDNNGKKCGECWTYHSSTGRPSIYQSFSSDGRICVFKKWSRKGNLLCWFVTETGVRKYKNKSYGHRHKCGYRWFRCWTFV